MEVVTRQVFLDELILFDSTLKLLTAHESLEQFKANYFIFLSNTFSNDKDFVSTLQGKYIDFLGVHQNEYGHGGGIWIGVEEANDVQLILLRYSDDSSYYAR